MIADGNRPSSGSGAKIWSICSSGGAGGGAGDCATLVNPTTSAAPSANGRAVRARARIPERAERNHETGEAMNDNEQNPIVAMAMKLRARRDLGAAIDSATQTTPAASTGNAEASFATDADASFAALAETLAIGSKRLNSILGKNGVTFVRLEKPLRLRLRFGGLRVALDLDRERQLVLVSGLDLDGEYQFDTSADVPALINLSKLSTDAGYGEPLTAATLLKTIAQDAELPRPAHLDAPGPMRF